MEQTRLPHFLGNLSLSVARTEVGDDAHRTVVEATEQTMLKLRHLQNTVNEHIKVTFLYRAFVALNRLVKTNKSLEIGYA